eukprot:GEMP01019595.1.p1 GENE.GEMP01019595.1~~GEMP01019595.1.p1  ORF type:complete len:239 (+),score=43.08 GEMP01019595.1:243-959(+)
MIVPIKKAKEESCVQEPKEGTGDRWIKGLLAANKLMQWLARKKVMQQPTVTLNTTLEFTRQVFQSGARENEKQWLNEHCLLCSSLPTKQKSSRLTDFTDGALDMARRGPFPLIVHPKAAYGKSETCRPRVFQPPVYDVEWLSRFYYSPRGQMMPPVRGLAALQPYMSKHLVVVPEMVTPWCEIEGVKMSKRDTLKKFGEKARKKTYGGQVKQKARMFRSLMPLSRRPTEKSTINSLLT